MAELFSNVYFIQGLGGFAFVLGVCAFSSKDDVRLKKLMIIQCATLSVHYYLLEAGGAVVATFLASTRTYASLYKRLKNTAPVFIVLYFVLGFYWYEQWVDMLPIIGSSVSTLGFFYLQKIPMRFCSIFSSALWIIHNIVVASIGPLFMEIVILLANIRTTHQLYIIKKTIKPVK